MNRGEISELKTATKGQIYLTLKDETSILSGVIWESKKNLISFKPEIGIRLSVSATIFLSLSEKLSIET